MFGKLFGKLWNKKAQESFEASAVREEEEDWLQDADGDEDIAFLALDKTFGTVTIKTVNRRNEGLYLQAACPKAKILMEYFENDLLDFPDGSNAYFFGNKLIIVTRWSDMSDSEKRTVETADLALAIHPYPCAQLSLKVGNNWGDVIVNLHHCWSALNDENAPVDEAIFLFADTQDPEYLTCRSVLLPAFVQKFLQKCNATSHKHLELDSQIQAFQTQFAEKPAMDFYNHLYDECWKKTSQFYDRARASDLENIPDGVYIEINSANKVTKTFQKE